MSDGFEPESCKYILVNKGVYWCKLPLRADATAGCAPNKHKHILNRTNLWKSVDVQGSEWKPLTWPCHGVVEIVSCHRGYRRRGGVPTRVGMPTPGRVSQPFRIRSFTRIWRLIFSRSPKVFRIRDVTITLDHTRPRPFLLVVTRLVIEAGGSVTQSTKSCHS